MAGNLATGGIRENTHRREHTLGGKSLVSKWNLIRIIFVRLGNGLVISIRMVTNESWTLDPLLEDKNA